MASFYKQIDQDDMLDRSIIGRFHLHAEIFSPHRVFFADIARKSSMAIGRHSIE